MKDIFKNIIYSQYPVLQIKRKIKYKKPKLIKRGKLNGGKDV